jgi:lactoylglutathione lyase
MKIEHIAIWVKDLEQIKAFYQKYFGAISNEKYINKDKGYSSYFLSFDTGARLEVMHNEKIPESKDDPFEQSTGLIHFAFSTGSKEQVDELTNVLYRDGYKLIDGPRATGDGYYESAVLDPEGNRIEITI